MMRLTILLLSLLGWTACGDDDPCEQLNRCCDAFLSDPVTPISCFRESFPTDDSACQEGLDALPAFAAEEGIEVPDACNE